MQFLKYAFIGFFILLAACQTTPTELKSQWGDGRDDISPQAIAATLSATPPPASTVIAPKCTATALIPSSPTVAATITPTSLPTDTPAPLSTLSYTPTLASSPDVLSTTWVFSDSQLVSNAVINDIAWAPGDDIFAAVTALGLFVGDSTTLEIKRTFNLGEKFTSVAFTPNTGFVVAADLKGDIHWHHPTKGSHLNTLAAHRLGVADFALPIWGEILLSGSDDGSLRLWVTGNVLNQANAGFPRLQEWQIDGRITKVAINATRQLAIAGTDQAIWGWDSGTGEPRHHIDNIDGWVTDLDISPSGDQLAFTNDRNVLQIWDTTTWRPAQTLFIEPIDRLTRLAFSPDGHYLALGGNNGVVVVWDLRQNLLLDPQVPLDAVVASLAFNSAAPQLLTGYDNGVVRVWDFDK